MNLKKLCQQAQESLNEVQNEVTVYEQQIVEHSPKPNKKFSIRQSPMTPSGFGIGGGFSFSKNMAIEKIPEEREGKKGGVIVMAPTKDALKQMENDINEQKIQ